MGTHLVVFSHGFGTRKDDRGLFTEIAAALPETEPVMFDYNEVDEGSATLTVRPVSTQAAILREVVDGLRKERPDAVIDLVCHSQGCLVAGIAKLAGIRRTVMLAPSLDADTSRMVAMLRNRPGTEIDMEGTSRIARADGSVTLVPNEYWMDRIDADHPERLYNALAESTELTVIIAGQDEVLAHRNTAGLGARITVIELEGNHSFTGAAREKLLGTVHALLA